MGNNPHNLGLRWYLIWLGLLLLLIGFWVPVPKSFGFETPPEGSLSTWYLGISVPMLLVLLSPILMRYGWPRLYKSLLLIYLVSAIWMCICTLFPPTSSIATHMVWIFAHAAVSLAFLLPLQKTTHGFDMDRV